MYFTYVLRSLKDGKNYTGYTNDVNSRLIKHNEGEVKSTAHRRPFELIYYEACLNKDDAQRRERYFKTYQGRQFLAKRLKEYLKK
jgi:putative endonuclease